MPKLDKEGRRHRFLHFLSVLEDVRNLRVAMDIFGMKVAPKYFGEFPEYSDRFRRLLTENRDGTNRIP